MQARITRSFRVAENGGTRKYTPGEVAKGRAAELALDNGWGVAIEDDPKGAEKKAPAPKNKAGGPAPKNKAS